MRGYAAAVRCALPVAAVVGLLAATNVRAQEVDRFVFVGFTTNLGLELSGVKVFAGYDYGRGDVRLELYAGALTLPPGPGVAFGIAGKYHILNDPTWRAGLGAQLGLRLGTGVVPVLQLTGHGEGRASIFGAYLQLKTGIPQVFGAALGAKLSLGQSSTWIEANTGVPFFINGEFGHSRGLF